MDASEYRVGRIIADFGARKPVITTLHRASFWPWNDRLGRFSGLRLVVFLALLVPAGWIAWQWQAGLLFPRVLNELIHQTGDWAIRLLVLTLAVTPLRHAAQWSRLYTVRRMLGLAALSYTLAHFAFYAVDKGLDPWKIASELVLRVYLTIGLVALIGLIILGSTSTDAMIARLGPMRWARLHRIVHAIAALAVVHFFLQSKIDASEATLMLGLWLYLEGCRLFIRRRIALGLIPLTGLAVAIALLTAVLEAGWYGLATKVPASAILAANLDLAVMVRPSWWVLAAGLAFAAIGGWRNRRIAKAQDEGAVTRLRHARA